MATSVPPIFSKVAPQVVSVSFIEYASGTGIIQFFAGDANSTAADTAVGYFLTSATPYSDIGATPSGYNAALDLDFDVVLNRATVIEGDCIISIPVMLGNNTGSTSDVTSTLTGELQHYDGSTETNLGTDTCVVQRNVNNASLLHEVGTVKFTVARTHFKKGDTLRVTVKSSAAGANKEVTIGHDPANRTDLFMVTALGDSAFAGTTQLIANIPILVDI